MKTGTRVKVGQGGLIWLASYPKSGNTWVRALLANLLKSRGITVSPHDLRHDYFGGNAAAEDIFERFAGEPSVHFSPRVIDQLRPKIYVQWGASLQKPTLIKVHDAWRINDQGLPIFPKTGCLGCVYVARNPLDVVTSMGPFYGTTLDRAIEIICSNQTGSYSKSDRPDNQLPQCLFDWSRHVESWIDSPIERKLILRYEDMLIYPEHCFGTLLNWFGVPHTCDQLRLAITASSFQRLQQKEQERNFTEKGKGNHPFFRSGKSGGWRTALTPQQIERIITCHGRVMTRLGYLDDKGNPL